jgi:hypothetical protein
MFFVYVLALVGLLAVIGMAAWVGSVWWENGADTLPADDPYDEALAAAARLQARAWEAVHELSQTDPETDR